MGGLAGTASDGHGDNGEQPDSERKLRLNFGHDETFRQARTSAQHDQETKTGREAAGQL